MFIQKIFLKSYGIILFAGVLSLNYYCNKLNFYWYFLNDISLICISIYLIKCDKGVIYCIYIYSYFNLFFLSYVRNVYFKIKIKWGFVGKIGIIVGW